MQLIVNINCNCHIKLYNLFNNHNYGVHITPHQLLVINSLGIDTCMQVHRHACLRVHMHMYIHTDSQKQVKETKYSLAFGQCAPGLKI